jgi:hypothetical protein
MSEPVYLKTYRTEAEAALAVETYCREQSIPYYQETKSWLPKQT